MPGRNSACDDGVHVGPGRDHHRFAVLIAADLVLGRNASGRRAAAVTSAAWVAAVLAFGGTLWLWQGPATAGQYFAGYLLEKALSVDNLLRSQKDNPPIDLPAARFLSRSRHRGSLRPS